MSSWIIFSVQFVTV